MPRLRGVAGILLPCSTLRSVLTLLACGGTSESTATALPDEDYAHAIAVAIGSARSCFQEEGYVIKAEDAHGFVVSTQDGPDESRVDGHAQRDGQPYLIADVPLDAEPDFRAEVHECVDVWQPDYSPPLVETNLP